MDEPLKPSAPPEKLPGQQTDALSKWTKEVGTAPTALEEIRLDQNERLIVPFTTSVEEVKVYYLDYASLRGYVGCTGASCLLCRIGRKADARDLWAAYDAIAQAVGVLAVPSNLRPQALRPQLIPVLQRLSADERLLLAIRKLDKYRFSVVLLPLQEEADDGADQIADFLARYEAGGIDLAAIYPKMSNEELASLPEVATVLKVRGIKL